MREKILLLLPCCIGDVVLATATLAGLRRGYPQAHITWAVGQWSAPVLAGHPLLDALLDTGAGALPLNNLPAALAFRQQLRAGHYDAVVSLVRSAAVNALLWTAGIPVRVGLDSGGRGRLHTVRAPLNPDVPQHEAAIYLSVLRAWGLDTRGCVPFIPVTDADRSVVRQRRQQQGIGTRYLVVNPAGGSNPGMTMDSKRYPPEMLAQLIARLQHTLQVELVLVGGPNDGALIAAVQSQLAQPAAAFVGELSLHQLGALASEAVAYLGNDTGLTHFANACGARTIMLMGPTDPRRYAPYGGDSLAVWKPVAISARGVAGAQAAWDWQRDGVSVDEAYEQVLAFMGEAAGDH